jgi:dipeptidyl aminopeptidase/acylaminoacyl peptidase
MAAKLRAVGVPSELLVMKGGGHDETTIREYLPQALAWFDKHLAASGGPAHK